MHTHTHRHTHTHTHTHTHADHCQTFIGLVLLVNFIMNVVEVERMARHATEHAHILKK